MFLAWKRARGGGEIDERKSSYDKALNKYKSVLKVSPENEHALAGVGRIMFLRKEYQSALGYFKKVHTIDPANIEYQVALGKCYHGIKQYEKALKYYNSVLTETSKYAEVFNRAGIIYLTQGLPSEAVDVYTKGIAAHPDMGILYLGRGIGNKGIGNTDAALKDFDEALEKGLKEKTKN